MAAGFPVKSTWLTSTKAGNFPTWSGLTYSNASKYHPESRDTIKGHMVQSRNNVQPTKDCSNNIPTNTTPDKHTPLPRKLSNKLHLRDEPLRKLYNNDRDRFSV